MGAIPQVPTVYEVLEEMAITVSCCWFRLCSLCSELSHSLGALHTFHFEAFHYRKWRMAAGTFFMSLCMHDFQESAPCKG